MKSFLRIVLRISWQQLLKYSFLNILKIGCSETMKTITAHKDSAHLLYSRSRQ